MVPAVATDRKAATKVECKLSILLCFSVKCVSVFRLFRFLRNGGGKQIKWWQETSANVTFRSTRGKKLEERKKDCTQRNPVTIPVTRAQHAPSSALSSRQSKLVEYIAMHLKAANVVY